MRSVVEVFTIFSIIVTLAVSTTTLKTTIDQNRRQNELTSQGQVADRFAKAVDQLNSPELGVRLGGIYSLQTIALDSKDIGYDRSAGSVLYAFVDQNSKNAPLCPTDLEVSKHNSTNPDGWGYGLRTTSPDVELAVQVLASIPYRSSPEINEPGHHGIFTDEQYASLTQVSKDEADRDTSTLVRWKPSKCWRDIELRHLDLHNWNLYGFDVSDAVFDGSTLNGAILDRTRLHGTKFRGSALDGAWLILVDGFGTDFSHASLRHAYLGGAQLCGADLTGAVLTGAQFFSGTWGAASLKGTTLNGADFSETNLKGIDLSEVVYDEHTIWPKGFIPPALPPTPRGVNCPPLATG